MPSRIAHQQKSDLIARVAAEARDRMGAQDGPVIAAFIEHYYANVPPKDLVAQGADALFGAALAHWKAALARTPGHSLVRVYTPSLEEHGWNADHTVVEVVTDDMPFLVDSVTAELNDRNLAVHLVIHPVFAVTRDAGGRPAAFAPRAEDGKATGAAAPESLMHVKISEQSPEHWDAIRDGVAAVLDDVRASVEDWQAMRTRMEGVIDDLGRAPKVAGTDMAEVVAFLQWIHDNHYTFLGYRDYTFKGRGDKRTVHVDPDTGLGVLRDPAVVVFRELQDLQFMSPDVRGFVEQPAVLFVTKANKLATVHRRVHMDAIGIKRFDKQGKVVGERVFVGLFTSAAYNRSARDIPLLRHKVRTSLERAGFATNGHDGKALINILETFPRDELFQISEDELLRTALGILHLQERQRVALFVRRDDFERFVSCLIYVPRDRYTTDLRRRLQAILEDTFAGTVTAHYSQLGDSALARLHIIVQTRPGEIPDFEVEEVEARLVEEARSWADRLQEALVADQGEEKGLALMRVYQRAFKSDYRERFNAASAVNDVRKVERALAADDLELSLYRPIETAEDEFRFKVYHKDRPLPLSDVLPMLENMGLKVIDEVPHAIRPLVGDKRQLVMLHDFGLRARDGGPVDLAAIRDNFQETFRRVWQGDAESDDFNSLILHAGLNWREVVVIRAYCKYLRQAGIAFSQAYMEQTLAANPAIARSIVALFRARFDPALGDGAEAAQQAVRQDLDKALEQVVSADEDRILRRFINIVESSLRTNFYQTGDDGMPKPYLSFKLDSRAVDELPLPRPLREIFVYSPRVEGVHLRFGLVARGGLRWSDRREDFRTEVLGLVKAQQVKNAVIVPVGSKGGFVLKRPTPPGDRDAFMAEGIACYKTFIRGLLDLTDNLTPDGVAPPHAVVRRDDNDPYLVVAADKGTATFSDIANGVAAEYGFWLGDAFASGGSQGYDHKGMGITARGAWESVKRHFREMGHDTQAQDFTVIGVGDMSGDVFGNGMLLSPHIRLLAAFNHLHIFIDPDPDPAAGFAERQRLFNLPRSSWTDYDAKLISAGGGVFERSAKAITLSPQIQNRFGILKDKVTPAELMRALLRADVDLLWFGGIGTYLKASTENHVEVGDRANDAIRIDAPELRCRVIGEGANLGLTQRSRIEAALAGVRLNTDFIDNSAGVDCSDHEVNIKILLDHVVANGDMTMKQRNALLVRMTDEVAELVLRDNYLQAQAITLVQSGGVEVLDEKVRLMRKLEKIGRLDRNVEFLPDDETLADRAAARLGLTRPEISVIISYAKIWLYDELLQSALPDDPHLAEDLYRYFPTPLQGKYKDMIGQHRLRREIIATRVTNSMINRVGGSFVNMLTEKTGMSPEDIARAYIVTREVYALRPLWDRIETLDNQVEAPVQTALMLEINKLIQRGTLWFLRNAEHPIDVGANSAAFAAGVAELAASLDGVLPRHYLDDMATRAAPLIERGVPQDLAMDVTGLVNMASGGDIVRLAAGADADVRQVARLYFAMGSRFRLGRLRAAAEGLIADTHWQKLAVDAVIEELYGHQLTLAALVLPHAGVDAAPERAIDIWAEENNAAVERMDQLLGELFSGDITDLSMIAVASRELRALSALARPVTAPAAAAAAS